MNKLYLVTTTTSEGRKVPYMLTGDRRPYFDHEEEMWKADIEIELDGLDQKNIPFLEQMEDDQIMEIEFKPIELTRMVVTYEPITIKMKK